MLPAGSSNPKTKMAATFMTGSSYTFIWQSSDANFLEPAYILKVDTCAHRMWVNVLPVACNKFNMAAETGSRNDLLSSSEIDAFWKLITSFLVMLNT